MLHTTDDGVELSTHIARQRGWNRECEGWKVPSVEPDQLRLSVGKVVAFEVLGVQRQAGHVLRASQRQIPVRTNLNHAPGVRSGEGVQGVARVVRQRPRA